MSMTAAGPMALEKAIEHLQQLLANQDRGSEEEVIVIVSRR